MIKYFSTENEIQKFYSQFGLVVPVGDRGFTKAPSIGILPSSSTQNTVTAQFNIMSGGDITALEYKVNDGAATSLTPTKGVVTITIEDLEYNSGPYEVALYATNEIGTTEATTTIALQPYTNWATPDEVLAGNRYIGEDSEEHVGEIVTKTSSDVAVHDGSITIPAGYYASQVSKTYPNPSGVINITTNGTDIDVTEYVYANVAVPASAVDSGTKQITTNGNNQDVIGYAAVDVAVPASAVVSGTLPITQNGTGIDVTNYAAVNVAVPTGFTGNTVLLYKDPIAEGSGFAYMGVMNITELPQGKTMSDYFCDTFFVDPDDPNAATITTNSITITNTYNGLTQFMTFEGDDYFDPEIGTVMLGYTDIPYDDGSGDPLILQGEIYFVNGPDPYAPGGLVGVPATLIVVDRWEEPVEPEPEPEEPEEEPVE